VMGFFPCFVTKEQMYGSMAFDGGHLEVQQRLPCILGKKNQRKLFDGWENNLGSNHLKIGTM